MSERFYPSAQKDVSYYEHFHRYYLASKLVEGKVVLDIASGMGYGSHILAAKAKSVLGIDISEETVEEARKTYTAPNLEYKVGDCSKIDLPTASIDVVVSFETIEHVLEQEEMINEIYRVLKADGLLIISSPNRPVFSKGGVSPNEYHVKELDLSEFHELLLSKFTQVQMWGQRLMRFSTVWNFAEAKKDFTPVYLNGQALNQVSEPMYFIALCTKTALDNDINLDTIFGDQNVDDEINHARMVIGTKEVEIEQARANIDHLVEEVAQARAVIKSKDDELTHARAVIESKDEELAHAKENIDNMQSDINGARDNINNLVSEITRARNNVDDLVKQVDTARRTIGDRDAEISLAKDSIFNLNAELVTIRSENERLLQIISKRNWLQKFFKK